MEFPQLKSVECLPAMRIGTGSHLFDDQTLVWTVTSKMARSSLSETEKPLLLNTTLCTAYTRAWTLIMICS